jgi:hypothetical protein
MMVDRKFTYRLFQHNRPFTEIRTTLAVATQLMRISCYLGAVLSEVNDPGQAGRRPVEYQLSFFRNRYGGISVPRCCGSM